MSMCQLRRNSSKIMMDNSFVFSLKLFVVVMFIQFFFCVWFDWVEICSCCLDQVFDQVCLMVKFLMQVFGFVGLNVLFMIVWDLQVMFGGVCFIFFMIVCVFVVRQICLEIFLKFIFFLMQFQCFICERIQIENEWQGNGLKLIWVGLFFILLRLFVKCLVSICCIMVVGWFRQFFGEIVLEILGWFDRFWEQVVVLRIDLNSVRNVFGVWLMNF